MIRKKIRIKNPAGIHVRPSTEIVTFVLNNISSSVLLESENGESDLRSPMSVLSLCLEYGEKVYLSTDESTDPETIQKLIDLIGGIFDYT
ncbi:MAG: HPr family phosphocarrier protein [Deltaproteobacteria bacterium]|nr:HPr family phosphocarrier protein [Deltaproteobacteria bacterium]